MALPNSSDEWPTPYEYDEALLRHQETFIDKDIQGSQLLKTTNTKPARLNGSGSQHVRVYRLGNWVVRCFTSDPPNQIRPPANIVQRYEGIISYLEQPDNHLPFLVKHEWIDPGIKLRDTTFPFLKLPYIAKSPPLGHFLSDLYDQVHPTLFSQVSGKLAREWELIVQQLEKKKIAHGDLDTSNILVSGTYPSLSLYLIDYDGMYVPIDGFEGMGLADRGHENFQPANASLRIFGPELDRFSALIIYLSLRGLELKPSLWESCDATQSCLLLGRDDYEHLGQSRRYALLYQESQLDSRLRNCLDELQISHGWRMPRSLREILNGYVLPVEIQPYTGNALVRPKDWAIKTNIQPSPSPQPDLFSQQSSPVQPVIPTQPLIPTPPPVLSEPRKTGRYFLIIVIILLVVLVLGLIIYYIVSHQTQQPSSSNFVLLMILSSYFTKIANRTESKVGKKRDTDNEA